MGDANEKEASETLAYPDISKDLDERRRAYILEYMANSEIDGNILVQNMDRVFRWLVFGEVPIRSEKQRIDKVR